jgi:putative transcriptional regulator
MSYRLVMGQPHRSAEAGTEEGKELMDKDDFASLRRGLDQVEAYKAGEREGFGVHEPIDVKAIRERVHKSQPAFAKAYHLPVGTVRDWEQGRRSPDAPARALLMLIEREPELVERMLAN